MAKKNRKILAPFLYYNLPPLLFFGNFEERNENETKKPAKKWQNLLHTTTTLG